MFGLLPRGLARVFVGLELEEPGREITERGLTLLEELRGLSVLAGEFDGRLSRGR